MNFKNLRLRLAILYFLIYATLACYAPFLAVYLNTKRFHYINTGIALAVNSLIGIAFQPFWGYIADKYSTKIKVLRTTILASSVTVLLFAVGDSFYFVLSSIIVFVAFQSPITSIADACCYEILEEEKSIKFGQIRLMGSVGFALSALALGKIIQNRSINILFFSFSILSLFTYLNLKRLNFSSKHSNTKININHLAKFFHNSKFVLIVLSVMIINISIGASNSYIAFLIESIGGDVSKVGVLWFVLAMSEIPAFFFVNRLINKFGELRIYYISLFIYSIRFYLSSIFKDYIIIVIIQALQSITFPLYLSASLQYVNKLAPNRIKASAITILSAIGFGLGGMLGNLSGGIIIEYRGIFYLYKLLAIISIIALLTALPLKYMEKIK